MLITGGKGVIFAQTHSSGLSTSPHVLQKDKSNMCSSNNDTQSSNNDIHTSQSLSELSEKRPFESESFLLITSISPWLTHTSTYTRWGINKETLHQQNRFHSNLHMQCQCALQQGEIMLNANNNNAVNIKTIYDSKTNFRTIDAQWKILLLKQKSICEALHCTVTEGVLRDKCFEVVAPSVWSIVQLSETETLV